MNKLIFTMEISSEDQGVYRIKVKDQSSFTFIKYSLLTRTLEFPENNCLSNILKKHEQQLEKIFHNKRENTFFPGFKLKFVLREDEETPIFNYNEKTVILDRRNGKLSRRIADRGEDNIYIIYTDGCFLDKINKGGYAVIIKTPQGDYSHYSNNTSETSSNLIELSGVIFGLKILYNIEKLRIVTDSHYVIKGSTSWIENWKENGWHTANGDLVKNIDHWKELDKLTSNRYIEFQWVKAHSNHFENTLCDLFARDAAQSTPLQQN